uniref:Putative secreted protein n=1 Tax=Ixodes ricinus TaxID=34613 RepID=A0A6B0U098_IXORI
MVSTGRVWQRRALSVPVALHPVESQEPDSRVAPVPLVPQDWRLLSPPWWVALHWPRLVLTLVPLLAGLPK